MTESETEYLTIKAACELLGVSHNTLRSWGAAEKIVEYRHPVNNYRLFRKDDVLELKERLANPQPNKSAPAKQRKAK
ncbi:Helix-turn-helix domain protein [Novipirellula aureliae]|uniref:Helix-turn-helix domain protein n=1 Tax=Novipirellula aureliae TaxID=2527966 RepID=A0A5C6ECM7_9BACT|nr:helix-turn-helix domain-containing protein [Novipirellula aureliae]TWU44939.1 Helix-turn-helix domain protein [Novipirellula aureliae]